jgi:hypothetical protein
MTVGISIVIKEVLDMATDLKIIEELGKEIGQTLEEIDVLPLDETHRWLESMDAVDTYYYGYYGFDSKMNVVAK